MADDDDNPHWVLTANGTDQFAPGMWARDGRDDLYSNMGTENGTKTEYQYFVSMYWAVMTISTGEQSVHTNKFNPS